MQHTLDTERIPRLLMADAIASLGEWSRAEVLAVVANVTENARRWLEDGGSLADVQRNFDRELVDHFQQDVHDEQWDATWPACPRHPHHPLWYDEGHEAWSCQKDGAIIARLGELTNRRPPPSHASTETPSLPAP